MSRGRLERSTSRRGEVGRHLQPDSMDEDSAADCLGRPRTHADSGWCPLARPGATVPRSPPSPRRSPPASRASTISCSSAAARSAARWGDTGLPFPGRSAPREDRRLRPRALRRLTRRPRAQLTPGPRPGLTPTIPCPAAPAIPSPRPSLGPAMRPQLPARRSALTLCHDPRRRRGVEGLLESTSAPPGTRQGAPRRRDQPPAG